MSRAHWMIAGVTGLTLLAGCATQWLLFSSCSEINGRHHASGQVQLSTGQVLDMSYNLHIDNGRFYSMTRQGSSILETSGVVEYGFLGNYRLRVERGEAHSLSDDVDDALIFNLMYAAHPNSTITLSKVDGCLFARETQQLFCPQI